MLAGIIAVLTFLAVAMAVLVLGRQVSNQEDRTQYLLRRRLRELEDDPGSSAEGSSLFRDDSRGRFATLFQGWLPVATGSQREHLRERLTLAGYPHPAAVHYFLVIQFGLMILLGLAGAIAGWQWGVLWWHTLAWGVAGVGGGLLAPSMALRHRITARQTTLRQALPDALDIMVLSIEGGASLNAAISSVAEELPTIHPILGAEFGTIHGEIQFGMSPGDAVREFAERCGLSEVRDLAAALTQSERYGASTARALRTFADSARQDRQVWAEEVAQKAAVKIMFPMLLCIFPAIFIVLLGPAAFQMSNLFAR